jgi:hypothetical protein
MLSVQEATMKTFRIALALALTLAATFAAESAYAWHRGGPRVVLGIGIGVPFAYPYYYPPYAPYYYPPYYPSPVVVQQPPPVYVEQPQAQPQPAQPQGYWYYCNDSRAYYPYVKECPGGWQRVAPQPG